MCDGKDLWYFRHSKVHISFVIKENGIFHPKVWPLMNVAGVVVDVATAWLETLLEVIELLPKDVIKKDVS